MSLPLILEIISTILGLGFLVLLIMQKIWCWPLGIIGSITSIFLFIQSKLYAEAILYGYYVVIGVYGWWQWGKPKQALPIVKWKWVHHAIIIAVGAFLSVSLGYFFETQTDEDRPYIDSTTTIFSFIASYLEAKKVLSGWTYWILINLATVFMYQSKSLDIYAVLMAAYFILSIVGYFRWKKEFELQKVI